MATEVIVLDSPTNNIKDYPRLMEDNSGKGKIYFMIGPSMGICLNHHETSYQGVIGLNAEYLSDFNGIIQIKNKH